jgi:hypothetical protein
MTICGCKPNCSLDEDLEILLPHVHQAQQWQFEVFLVIAMKVHNVIFYKTIIFSFFHFNKLWNF